MLVQIPGTEDYGRHAYVVQYQEGEFWNRLSTGLWTRSDRIQSLQIAFRDPRTERLAMRGAIDTQIWVKQP